jgi:CheY-like chemotaxis protein
VVEDNAMNQMVIKMITKKWLNTTVLYANNGQEGLDVFKTNKIDIVLMDSNAGYGRVKQQLQ